MSDSDGNDIINPDAAVFDLTTTLDATKTHVIGPIIASSTLTSGFSTTKIVHDELSLADVVSSLVGDIFLLNNQKLIELTTQLSNYFKGSGIYDKEILLIMSDCSIWPQTINLPMITVPSLHAYRK